MTHRASDLSTGLILQLLALSTPIIVTAVARDAINTVVSGLGLAAILAACFVTILMPGFQHVKLNRIDFLIASVIGPVMMFLSVVVVKAILWHLLNFVEGWGGQRTTETFGRPSGMYSNLSVLILARCLSTSRCSA